MRKGILIAGISTALLLGMPCCVCGASFEQELSDAAAWHRQQEQDKPGTSESDWFTFAVERAPSLSEQTDPAGLEAYVTQKYQTAQKLSPAKATEWHRISLTLRAMGVDPAACGTEGSIDLIADGTYDRGRTAALDRQGLTGWIWALITLHSGEYPVPAGAHDTEADMICQLLSRQQPDGGFALAGTRSDVDVTAAAVAALAPLYSSDRTYTYTRRSDGAVCTLTVRQTVDQCMELLSGRQLESGGFASYGTENAESSAQVILALLSLGRDPRTDPAFQAGGHDPVEALLAYRRQDGGFAHSSEQTGSNVIATNQCMLALAGIQRLDAGMCTVYDLTDVQLKQKPVHTAPPAVTEPIRTETPEPEETMSPAEPSEPVQTEAAEPETTAAPSASGTAAVSHAATTYVRTQAVSETVLYTYAIRAEVQQSPAEHPAAECAWWVLGLACMALGGCMLWERKE